MSNCLIELLIKPTKKTRGDKPIPNPVELQTAANSYGYIPAFFMIFGFVCFCGLGGYLWILAKKIHSIFTRMESIDQKLTHEKGDPQVHYSILNQISIELRELRQDFETHATGATRHYDTAEALNDSEPWTRCHVDKCPNLTRFQLVLQSIQERFSQFEATAAESRANTSHSLDSINISVQQVGKDLGKEIADTFKLIINLLPNKLGGKN